jgi:hypothetical protein
MARSPRLVLLLALSALLGATLAAPAQAAKRKVPFGFFGMTITSELVGPGQLTDAQLDAQMAAMARSGVESLRTTISWGNLEPTPGRYAWGTLDRLVGAAARRGIRFFPNISTSPRWASRQPNSPEFWRYGPKDPNAFARLMRQAVLRYGPNGTFWSEHRGDIPRPVPVRQWQIWNEQVAPWFWNPQPWPRSYVRLLKPTYRAIHRADRGAKVVPGGFVGVGRKAPWDNMTDLYKAGGKGYFDAIAVHPFTLVPNSVKRTIDQTVEIIRLVRQRMRRRGDGRKPIYLTEMTWPAALGRVVPAAVVGLETTPLGQAQRLTAGYRRLARKRRTLRVTEAYWFSWATDYVTSPTPSGNEAFRFAGLNRYAGRGQFFPLPVLNAYANVAAAYEGCRKSDDARVCRR